MSNFTAYESFLLENTIDKHKNVYKSFNIVIFAVLIAFSWIASNCTFDHIPQEFVKSLLLRNTVGNTKTSLNVSILLYLFF